VSRDLVDKIKIKGFAFDADLIVKAYDSGYRIREVPIVWNPVGGSKVNLRRHVVEMGKDLLRIWWDRS